MKTNTTMRGYYSRRDVPSGAAEFYEENGYLVVHDALTAGEIKELRAEAVAICRNQRGDLPFGWGKQNKDAPIPGKEELGRMTDDEVIGHFLCIHQPHKTSPAIRTYLAHPVIIEVLTRVIGPNVKCMQSMLFIKSAGKPGQAWHQDEDYIPTRDRTLTGAWMALDDAVVDNGCLWIIPGSNRPGVLWPMYPHNEVRYDCAEMSYDFPYTDRDAIPVEAPAGAMVFFNGYTLHKSEPNRRAHGFRRALVNHYMSAESLLPWFVEEGVCTARMDYRDIVMVAGEDPYAWKGLREIAHPHVRPAGEGGCGDGRMDLEAYKKRISRQ